VTESNQTRREIVAQNITAAREAAGLSKRRLAKLADVGEQQVRLWEGGRHAPEVHNLLKLAQVLGQSLEWFHENHDRRGPGAA
jgi:transcriptional regulator with XRE-family HTH domain